MADERQPDWTKMMFGRNARHVPAWIWVQDGGDSVVTVVGASRIEAPGNHPLRYGSQRTHQLIVGELIVRPHVVIATDQFRGNGLNWLLTAGATLQSVIDGGGEVLVDITGVTGQKKV